MTQSFHQGNVTYHDDGRYVTVEAYGPEHREWLRRTYPPLRIGNIEYGVSYRDKVLTDDTVQMGHKSLDEINDILNWYRSEWCMVGGPDFPIRVSRVVGGNWGEDR